jgi:hypothetical protein
MKIDSESIQKGIGDGFFDWAQEHCVSFPNMIETAIKEAFTEWLENHSTQIIAEIAKSYVESTGR